MNNEISEESEVAIETPLTAEELMASFLQDLVLNNDPNLLANDFINEFVLTDRPETTQILAMLEMPIESLMDMVKQIIEQGYQTQQECLANHGIFYLEGLKAAIRERMTTLAQQ